MSASSSRQRRTLFGVLLPHHSRSVEESQKPSTLLVFAIMVHCWVSKSRFKLFRQLLIIRCMQFSSGSEGGSLTGNKTQVNICCTCLRQTNCLPPHIFVGWCWLHRASLDTVKTAMDTSKSLSQSAWEKTCESPNRVVLWTRENP